MGGQVVLAPMNISSKIPKKTASDFPAEAV